MKKIDTWLTFDDGRRISCGEMIGQNPDDRGWIKGAFRYSPEYLEHHHAFPLDPVSLALSPEIFEPNRSAGIFAVFEDSLPDDWGRRLLIRKAKLSRPRQTAPDLLIALGGTGMGALSYFEKDNNEMVFNALVGNTDDHLKNFTMLHGRNGFYLSPAYDLLPDIANRREHVLYFSNASRFPGHTALIDMGRKLDVTRPKKIVDQIKETVSGWKDEFEQFEVPGHDIDRLAWDFNRRLTG